MACKYKNLCDFYSQKIAESRFREKTCEGAANSDTPYYDGKPCPFALLIKGFKDLEGISTKLALNPENGSLVETLYETISRIKKSSPDLK